MKIGYMRVSTDKQTTDLQKDALERAGCDRIHEDVGQSGMKRDRKGLEACLRGLQTGDTLVVWKLDRLGRSLSHLMSVVADLKKSGVFFESLTEKIDTNSPSGELLFHVMGALAQFERALIRERVMAGLQAAKDKGKKLGRPVSISSEAIEHVQYLDRLRWHQGAIANETGISQSSVSRILKLDNAATV